MSDFESMRRELELQRAQRPRPTRAPTLARVDRPVVSAEQRAAWLAICDGCEHYTEGDYGKPACDLVTCCGRSRTPSALKFAVLTKCPLDKWEKGMMDAANRREGA